MRIEVTAEDIAKGERKQCRRCPIALAAIRAGLRGVRVDLTDSRALIEFDGTNAEAELPPQCFTFITRFDDGDTSVRPFSFDLDITP